MHQIFSPHVTLYTRVPALSVIFCLNIICVLWLEFCLGLIGSCYLFWPVLNSTLALEFLACEIVSELWTLFIKASCFPEQTVTRGKTKLFNRFHTSFKQRLGRECREWWQPCRWCLQGSCSASALTYYTKQQWHEASRNLSHTCGGIPAWLRQSALDREPS